MDDNGKEPQITSGVKWRQPREEGIIVPLPSGNVARLRPVALDVMISSGKLPDMLTPIAVKTLWTEMGGEEISNAVEMATQMADLFHIVCKASFIEPKIVDDPQEEDEIAIDDISFTDKGFVFNLAIQPAEVLRKFRDEQIGSLAALSSDTGDKPKAKSNRRSK